jgi:polyferredoxin
MQALTDTPLIVWLRRASQGAFLLLYLYLFVETVFHAGNSGAVAGGFFFDIDPLLTLSVWLSGHPVTAAMGWSVLTLVLTVILGRWFCGWVCPLGTVHTLFSALRRLRNKEKLQIDAYSRWQQLKYYVLIAVLIGALSGTNLVGWLDPISFLTRSMTSAVYPALNAGTQHIFEWIYQHDVGIGNWHLAALTEPVYRGLRYYVLSVGQPKYLGAILVGSLFGLVVALNLYRLRFWCRYVCPLGALLGCAGRTPLIRMWVKQESCTNCRACVIDCHGACDPESEKTWRAAECYYCMNCIPRCRPGVISVGADKAREAKPCARS